MPWIKKKRRQKWYRNKVLKTYSALTLGCFLIAALLSISVDKLSIFIQEPKSPVIGDRAQQLDKSATPNAPTKLNKPVADIIDLGDSKQLEQWKKTYSEKKKLDDQDRERIEELKQKYSNKLDPEEQERLKERYRQSRTSDSQR
jgi:hypothetical protein